ncbi:MAG: YihY/virulence factor BrkB family protein [Kineosporiaceae bacterium]
MSADTEVRGRGAASAVAVGRSRVRQALQLLGRLVAGTVRVCLRYRVTGLAAEAGFFALLSMPPLVLGLVGSIGYASRWVGSDVVNDLRGRIAELAGTFLTTDAVNSVILPTFEEVTQGGRVELVSLGFLLSLWSGSRALNVYVDTVSIMYGLGGHRGIVRTRALSFSLYVAGLLLGVVVLPLVLVGPGLLQAFLSQRLDGLPSLAWMGSLYWPVVTVLSVVGLATLYHVATPVRTPWRRDVPGAVLALVIWVGASFVLRVVISASVGGTSIYGPLSTPIVVLIWLYSLAIAVLIGAALNAALDGLFPHPARVAARQEGGSHAGETPITPSPEKADSP